MSNDDEPTLTADEIRNLRNIAGTMVPEDTALGMPGAGDPAILAGMLADLARSRGRDLPLVREALAGFRTGQEVNDWYRNGGAPAETLGRVILAAYYRDDRVLLALGLEARAPFPKGHTVEQGDWSLLDPVRGRAPFWRDDRTIRDGKR